MTKVLYVPQVNDQNKLRYTFEGKKINATLDGKTDSFDFTGLPDGTLDAGGIETDLPINPIVSAKIEGGVLYVELLRFIKQDATHAERFPEWGDAING